MTQNVLFKVPNQRLIVLVVAATVITGGIAFYGISQYGLISQSASSQLEETPPVTPKI